MEPAKETAPGRESAPLARLMEGGESPAGRAPRAGGRRARRAPRPGARERLEALRARGSQGDGEPLDLSGQKLRRADLSGLDLSFTDLSDADLSEADLTGTTLERARLEGALLFRARLEGARLAGSDLSGASLEGARARKACFARATLVGASLEDADLAGATLDEADLSGAEVRGALLVDARLRGARLVRARLEGADLRGCDLERADVRRASFDDADLRGARPYRLKGFESARWVGADLRDVDPAGAHHLARFARHQNHVEELRARGGWRRALHVAWWLTSDCGRSVVRWLGFTLAVAFAFALARRLAGAGAPEDLASAFLRSLESLTSLGAGDAAALRGTVRVLALAETVVGYLLVGGLLGIVARKVDPTR